MQKAKILVVEDEYILALDLENQLESLGYAVAGHAASGREAIRKAKTSRPDLILMDIKIRGPMDGIETAKAIGERFDIPVLYLTAFSDAEFLKRAKITKAFGYLIKPVKKQELAANIEMALDKHALEQTIRRNEAWYLSMLSSIGDGVIATDEQGRICFMNSVAERLMGRSSSEATGEMIDKVFSIRDPLTFKPLSLPIDEVIRKSIIFPLPAECELSRPNNEILPIGGNVAPLLGFEGNRIGIVLTFRDMSIYRDLEQRLRNLERFRIFSQIASGVAHEVRNPLNAIQAITAAMELELESNPDVKSYFEHIQAQVKRLSVLMQDLLELGRPVQPSSLKAESAVEICEDAVVLWRQSSEADVEVVFTPPKNQTPSRVRANAERMHQVLFNLLENASQHSPPGGTVTLTLEPVEGGMLRIRVRDEGSGIPEALLERVFEPFFTLTKGGIGLGLSIVKNIVEQHYGRIIVQNNNPPPGCSIDVLLPLPDSRS